MCPFSNPASFTSFLILGGSELVSSYWNVQNSDVLHTVPAAGRRGLVAADTLNWDYPGGPISGSVDRM